MANDFDLPIKWLNGSQIEVQSGDAAALTGNEKVLIMQNDSPKETTTQAIADLGGAASSTYLVYTALLTQTGTDAPIATVLENTLGGVPVWTYVSTGVYRVTLTGAFPYQTAIAFIGQDNGALNGINYVNIDTDNRFVVQTYDFATPDVVDGKLSDTAFEIRVYP